MAVTLSLAARSGHGQTAPEFSPGSLPDTRELAVEHEGQTLREQIEELRLELRRKEAAEQERNRKGSRLTIGGYLDFGFFVPNGNNGVGWVRDEANHQFPEFSMPGPHGGPFSWVFLGDILATPVNTRGEPADLGDAAGIDRFDSVDSDGAAGFLVNEVNLRLDYQLATRALLRTSINFAPRSGRRDFDLGDLVDVDLAEVEYVLTQDGGTSLFVGKTLPVFGIEYRERKSHQRFGITPSLVHRYTSGPQLGIKLRSKLFADWLILAASATNNSSTTEQFHFQSEIDKNWGKTLNGRAALSVPVGNLIPFFGGDRLEVGVSGEWGPQDRARNNGGEIWFAGVDLQYLGADFAIKAQLMRGGAPGRAQEGVWALDLHHSGYVEVDWQFLAFLGVLVRGEARDALVTMGADRIYLTKSMRFTGGLRVVFNPHAVLKAEYLHNREYGGIAQFDNDVFTTSLVLAF